MSHLYFHSVPLLSSKDFNLTLGRITGLDPAEPHFAKNHRPVRLDRSAAKYVDVVHTDASAFIRGGFGIIEPIGHVDFFPNGGTAQPGCTNSVVEYISNEKSLFVGKYRDRVGLLKFLRNDVIVLRCETKHKYFRESIPQTFAFGNT